ncbi:glycosyltransferase family 87 protein [Parapedobacter koreensis]|uniref:Alpha-1,2-mannosyltransferase n=1 Tax=Parapedobacter koreensis TaxID=332977 RepID=A0A1H7IH56_9SPHI|nr:glycosyltransferase family 87 protein [Parapedobacter koreensis]SEK61738.1 Protein of unknown function [Parapedobacter koreensis]
MRSLTHDFKQTGKVARLFLFIISLNLLYAFVLTLIHSKPNAFSQVKWLFYSKPYQNDSWKAMTNALMYMKQFPDSNAYQTLLMEKGIKFQYPPSSLLLFDIPQRITGLDYTEIARLWDVLSFFSVFLIAFFASKILSLTLATYRFSELNISSTANAFQQYILVLAITVLFYPLIRSYQLGQIQTLLTLFATMSIYFWLANKKGLSGLFIGLVCLVKPQLGLLFVWALIRRQWTMIIAGGITVVAVLAVSIALYGFHNHLDYLSALSFLSRHGEAQYANQSVNGLVHRLLFNGENVFFQENEFPPYSPVVYISTMISTLILTFLGLLWNRKKSEPDAIDLAIMMLCTTIASPIAWEHHYGILLPIFILLTPFACHFYRQKKWKLLLFSLAFVIASQYLEIAKKLADTRFNILQSYLFFAALIILMYSLVISKKLKTNGLQHIETY